MANNFGYSGAQDASSGSSEYNAISFLIAQQLARLNISAVVKVIKVVDPGGVAPTGTVDIQPMVNQIDGSANAVSHGVIFNVPYFRLQGGANAIIITPQVGDIGIALFADRDISSVKATKKQGNPGSFRRFDMADALYIGGMLNAAPVRYVKIDDNGVTIEGVANVTIHGNNTTINANQATINAATVAVNATTSATVTSPTSTVNGNVQINGTLTVS